MFYKDQKLIVQEKEKNTQTVPNLITILSNKGNLSSFHTSNNNKKMKNSLATVLSTWSIEAELPTSYSESSLHASNT